MSMEFRNLTPFATLCFASLDAQDTPFRTIVMRVGYRLETDKDGYARLVPIDDDPVPLCVQDECFEALNTSSPRWESDLAPYKPACDIIVIGSAHAPGGRAVRRIEVACRVQRPDKAAPLPPRPEGLNPMMPPSAAALDAWHKAHERARTIPMPGEVLLDKHLIVTGERSYSKHAWPLLLVQSAIKIITLGLVQPRPWSLTRAQPFAKLPLRYEYAWGGQCRINAQEKAARSIPAKYRLSPTQQAEHPDADLPPEQRAIAHAVCEANPLGRGFVTPWYLKALHSHQIPAPRIEYPQAPCSAETFWRETQAQAHADAAKNTNDPDSLATDLASTPAGLGAVARPWLPRRALAGTYDQAWLDERHPWSPQDFDFAYWNCAPEDQQVPYLVGDERLSFTNLCDADTPGVQRDQNGNSVLRCALPRHRAFVLTRWHNGLLLPLPMRIDTLIADLDAHRIDLIWRLVLPEAAPIRVIEARYEVDPAAPLVRLAPADSTEPAHG